MQVEKLQDLVKKYLNNTASIKERKLLSDWYNNQNNENTEWIAETDDEEDLLKAEMLNYIQQHTGSKTGKVHRLWPRVAAAASIILFISLGAYFVVHKNHSIQSTSENKIVDVGPGSNKATLKTQGKEIILDNAKNGTIINHGNVSVNKKSGGEISYAAIAEAENYKVVYDTITVPRGGTFNVTLSDGTKMWLNAATTVRYPEKFSGTERKVELLTGEAYFEVIHNAKMPFRVLCNDQLVEDIGTHFNIKAYKDELVVKTTLVEGRIKVSADGINKVINPGQQTILTNNQINIVPVDVEEETAWKNGDFQFDNEDVRSVMKELARWYVVDIKYEGNFHNVHYSGLIPRSSNISAVLRMLKETGNTNFKLDGKTVIVTK
ncbi:FecR family protein [Mucilaginibacter sp. L196]|uniref:FecR family protein n=1 Tax=Mucilaginibacter sp. L196 TaxID=1641870 RepID=UPI00131D2A92|nr:FecR family protein [Mucilaginibacter sp. L196]